MKICSTCGLEVTQHHMGIVDCVQGYRAYIADLHAVVADLQRQVPPGEAAYVGPIARDVKARLWLEGLVTPDAIDHLIKTLELLKDTYPVAVAALAQPGEAVKTKAIEITEQESDIICEWEKAGEAVRQSAIRTVDAMLEFEREPLGKSALERAKGAISGIFVPGVIKTEKEKR